MAQVSDLFTRANENPLASPWSSVGTGCKLASNTAQPSAVSTACISRHTGVDAGNQQFCKVKMGTLGVSSTIIIALGICYNTGGANTGYRMQYNGSDTFVAKRVTGGTEADLDSISHTMASGDVFVFWLDGGNLKFSINGTPTALNHADATYTSGNPALILFSNNLVADLPVVEFYGGDGTDWTGGASAVPLLMMHYN